jgi:hypothetical protein
MKQSFVTYFLLSSIDLYDSLPKNVTFGSSLSAVRIVCKANTFKTSSHIELPLLPHLRKFIFASLFTFLTLKATPSNFPTFLQSLIFKHHTTPSTHPPTRASQKCVSKQQPPTKDAAQPSRTQSSASPTSPPKPPPSVPNSEVESLNMKVEDARVSREYTFVRTMREVVSGVGGLWRSLMWRIVRGRRGSMRR